MRVFHGSDAIFTIFLDQEISDRGEGDVMHRSRNSENSEHDKKV